MNTVNTLQSQKTDQQSETTNVSWPLVKYARAVVREGTAGPEAAVAGDGQPKPNEETWQHHQGDGLKLLLTTNHHLMVMSQGKILENVSLWNASDWLKGVRKGDSMMIISKKKDQHYKFRMKLGEAHGGDGIKACSHCFLRLSSYFPIRNLSIVDDNPTVMTATPPTEQESAGAECVGSLAQALITGEDLFTRLPTAVTDSRLVAPETIHSLLKLCLTDANFPAFVAQVEQGLKKIEKDG